MKSISSTIEQTDEERVQEILVDQVPVGICIIQDRDFHYANYYFLNATGYTLDELMDRDSLEIVVPEDREMVREHTTRILKGETLSPCQFRVICKDGSISWFMATFESIQYHGRQAVLGNYMEITGRKKLEDALKANEERYRELADSITDVFFAMNEQLRYTYWNKASELLTEIRAEDAIGKSLLEIFPDSPGLRKAEKIYRAVLRTQRSQTFVNDFDIDGKHYIFEISAYPSRGGISVFVKDITERKQVEESKKEAEEEKNALLEEAPVGIMHTDLKGKVIYINKRFESESGYLRDEIVGKNGFRLDWLPVGTMKYLAKRMDARLKGRPGKHWETQFKCKDGRWIWVELEGKVLRKLGVPVGFQLIARNITERKQAEEALNIQKAYFQQLFDSSPDAIIVLDINGKLNHANKGFEALFGYSAEELKGRSPRKLIIPEGDLQESATTLHGVFSGEVVRRETVRRRKDGRLIDVSVLAYPILVNDKLVGAYFIYTDVTQRKQAEEALQTERNKLQSLVDAMEDTVTIRDTEYNVIYQNGPSLIGSGGDRRGEKCYRAFEGRDTVCEGCPAEKAFKDGKSHTAVRSIEISGKITFWENIANPIRDAEGKIVSCLEIGRDITDRKQAEAALKQSEEKYRALFDSTVIGTVVIDSEDLKVVMANHAAALVLGFSSTMEMTGVNLLDILPLEDRDRMRKFLLEEFFEQDLQRSHELRMMSKDGREIWISANGARIMHEDRLMGLVCFTDITEKKQQNERLMMTDRLASLGELASGAAHELNNPLTSIIGFSQLLVDKEVPDDIREELKLINNEARRAVIVTNNFLSFARRHSSTKQLNQINNIIEDVLELRAHEHKVNHIDVERNLSANLPEIMVDYFQMQQVFMNIIINAEYFMIKMHNKGTLTITTEKKNSTLRVVFADDGPGITAENLRRIFDPFFTTKEVGSGTGLGLSICHGIVSEHGGQIYATSELGKGTTVVIELPIKKPARIKSLV